MVGVVSVAVFLCGVALACAADRYPERTATLERSGGVLMLSGLALLGWSLPFVP